MGRRIFASVALLVLWPVTVLASETETKQAENSWTGAVSVGAVSWSDLRALQPAAGGSFDSLGFAIEGSLHEFFGKWRTANVYIGGDFGLFITESDVPGIFGGFSQRGLYLTPSIRLRYATSEKTHIDITAGAGYYEIDFAELLCLGPCVEIQEADSARAFGGFVGIAAGIGKQFVADLKVHFAEFGNIDGLGQDAGTLKGPIVSLSVGWRFLH